MSKWKEYNHPKKRGRYLIKFMSQDNLLRFLENGEIWFSRASEFGDKMECVTIDDLKKTEFPFDKLLKRKHRHLISCWHNVGRESISMWDTSFLSLRERRVYAIKFEFHTLVDRVSDSRFECNPEELHYGNVVYKNLLRDKEQIEKDRVRSSAFRKEYSYKYEQEFRFVARRKQEFSKVGYGLMLGPAEQLEFQIMVNPLLKKDEYKEYKEQVMKHRVGKNKYTDSELVRWLQPLKW